MSSMATKMKAVRTADSEENADGQNKSSEEDGGSNDDQLWNLSPKVKITQYRI